MSRMMHIAILSFSIFLPVATFAQVSPVRLKVSKNMKKDMERGSQHLVRETVSYTIEVTNASTTTAQDVLVRWAVLVTPGYRFDGSTWSHVGQRILEGERKCSIERIQKCVFESDPIEIAAYVKKEYYSRYKSDITAYYVEALVDGVVVAADIQPSNAKLRIQEEKGKKSR